MLNVSSDLAESATSPEDAFSRGLKMICSAYGWPVGHVYIPLPNNPDELESSGVWYIENSTQFQTFKRVTEATNFKIGIGLPGRVLESRKPAWIVDVTKDPNFPRAKQAEDIGVKAAFAFPISVSGEVRAVWEFYAEDAFEPDPSLLTVVDAVGSQVGRVLERFFALEYRERAAEVGQKSENLVRRIELEMSDIRERNKTIERSLRDIQDIIKLLRLVAINAQIEASRMGALGASFGVVANEIGRMSEEMTRTGAKVSAEVLESQDTNEILMARIQEITSFLLEVTSLQEV